MLAGTSKLVCAVISVPDTASAGPQDVFFQAKSPASLALDVIHVQVSVQ